MSSKVVPFFPIFHDIDGDPLSAGNIYIGTSGLNPETNPISVYWDAALTTPAAQPIRTIGGYPSRSGSPAALYVGATSYSVTVRNKNGSLITTTLSDSSTVRADELAATDSTVSIAGVDASDVATVSKTVAHYGADSTGVTGANSAFSDADAAGSVIVGKGLYKISANLTITSDMFFYPGSKITVDSGITLTISGDIHAGLLQEIFTGSGSVVITKKFYSIHWFDSVAQSMRSLRASDNVLVCKNMSWSGAEITVNANFFGLGREYLEITGSHTLTGTGGNSTFNNIHFKTPTVGTTLVTVSGVGGMNYRDCQLNPGAGNLMFDWDRDGTTPQICELMQTKFISGKLCKAEDSGSANTYTFHVKESSLFSSTEADLLNPVGGNILVLAIYNTLVNIGHAQLSPNDKIQLKLLAGCTVDDNTTSMAWFDNNSIGFDVLDISANATLSFDSSQRYLGVAPFYAGTGVNAANTNWKTVPSSNLETFNPDLFDEVFYEGTATALTFVQSWVFSTGSGRFKGQRFKLHIVGSIPTSGNNVVVFGRTFNPASNDMQGLRVEGVFDGSSWVCSYSDLI